VSRIELITISTDLVHMTVQVHALQVLASMRMKGPFMAASIRGALSNQFAMNVNLDGTIMTDTSHEPAR
jgi:hypothetical protein